MVNHVITSVSRGCRCHSASDVTLALSQQLLALITSVSGWKLIPFHWTLTSCLPPSFPLRTNTLRHCGCWTVKRVGRIPMPTSKRPNKKQEGEKASHIPCCRASPCWTLEVSASWFSLDSHCTTQEKRNVYRGKGLIYGGGNDWNQDLYTCLLSGWCIPPHVSILILVMLLEVKTNGIQCFTAKLSGLVSTELTHCLTLSQQFNSSFLLLVLFYL